MSFDMVTNASSIACCFCRTGSGSFWSANMSVKFFCMAVTAAMPRSIGCCGSSFFLRQVRKEHLIIFNACDLIHDIMNLIPQFVCCSLGLLLLLVPLPEFVLELLLSTLEFRQAVAVVPLLVNWVLEQPELLSCLVKPLL